ncbi:hypothetical protein HBI56_025590 [Parastagonospora nodorum]|uniref:BTB domain-containing protein n=1 Tax=Phaeosphaeria nodorum (strain SN15 / ATCC MYA-4574 / FGSC 10173) TaxID=321614 RepID=A0A7U2EY16_PHANO|nr:hypothetical protein HBH56_013250 [Parastagonospora nodorum]QRC94852.1 hypothetical protein JI435_301790 [Parastagonospora nodorum SN15]KAH3937234.1 hypothetical protein HBH54_021190 [Parastagonospora nodorum]KAH3953660.1 hypothetical protein HBH53_033590 [Parastagonospora nodorum]KAH3969506.1 hypothetical protein HBH51_125750 [Parastagonospora nodorum]
MAEASLQHLIASFKGFLTSGDYSDLVITCGSDSYNVHKLVVCSRADFFARAVKFGGKASSLSICISNSSDVAKEATEGKIDLPEDEPKIIKLLIQYLYEGEYEPRLSDASPIATAPRGDMSHREVVRTDNYNTGYDRKYAYSFPHTCDSNGHCTKLCICPHHICCNACGYSCRDFICDKCTRSTLPKTFPATGPPEQLLIHAKMYEIADKYDVVGLKDLVLEKFKRACVSFWDHDIFSIAAHYAFSTTMENDKGLRDIVSGTISEHMELIQKAEIQTLMTEFNGLALGILLIKADEHGWVKK